MPSSNHAVESPVPVPSSSRGPPGFVAASTRSIAPVLGSDGMLNPTLTVRSRIADNIAGGFRCARSSMARDYRPLVSVTTVCQLRGLHVSEERVNIGFQVFRLVRQFSGGREN